MVDSGVEGFMTSKLFPFVFSCKDEAVHREFKKQTGASCVYYHDELAVLVALVSNSAFLWP